MTNKILLIGYDISPQEKHANYSVTSLQLIEPWFVAVDKRARQTCKYI